MWTAGADNPGRGTTNTCLLADEAAFWLQGERILAGMFQSIALLPGSIIIINSTSHGAQGVYYDLWNKAEKGEGIFKPLFVPWFLQDEYTLESPEGLELTVEEKKQIIDQFKESELDTGSSKVQIALLTLGNGY